MLSGSTPLERRENEFQDGLQLTRRPSTSAFSFKNCSSRLTFREVRRSRALSTGSQCSNAALSKTPRLGLPGASKHSLGARRAPHGVRKCCNQYTAACLHAGFVSYDRGRAARHRFPACARGKHREAGILDYVRDRTRFSHYTATDTAQRTLLKYLRPEGPGSSGFFLRINTPRKRNDGRMK